MYGGHVWLLCYLYVWGSCLVIVLLVWMGVMFGYCVTCIDGGHVWLLYDLYGWGSYICLFGYCVTCMMGVMFGYCVTCMGVMFGYCVTCMDGGHMWLLCDLYGWGGGGGSCLVIV